MKVPKEKFPKVEINVEIEYAFMQCSEESNGKKNKGKKKSKITFCKIIYMRNWKSYKLPYKLKIDYFEQTSVMF